MSLQISSVPLDAASKAILAKLVSNGWNKLVFNMLRTRASFRRPSLHTC